MEAGRGVPRFGRTRSPRAHPDRVCIIHGDGCPCPVPSDPYSLWRLRLTDSSCPHAQGCRQGNDRPRARLSSGPSRGGWERSTVDDSSPRRLLFDCECLVRRSNRYHLRRDGLGHVLQPHRADTRAMRQCRQYENVPPRGMRRAHLDAYVCKFQFTTRWLGIASSVCVTSSPICTPDDSRIGQACSMAADTQACIGM